MNLHRRSVACNGSVVWFLFHVQHFHIRRISHKPLGITEPDFVGFLTKSARVFMVRVRRFILFRRYCNNDVKQGIVSKTYDFKAM